MAENRVIGRNNSLPWHLPADMKRFRTLTMGHAVLMGRRTFDTLLKPLPGRRNLVLTRNRDWSRAGVDTVATLAEAMALAGNETELFVAGGAEIYQMALPRADRMQLTVVHAEIEGDTRFPEFSTSEWALAEDEPHAADARHAFPFSFRRYERRFRAS